MVEMPKTGEFPMSMILFGLGLAVIAAGVWFARKKKAVKAS
jgi:LPXTG-motif cell wall-anchored protein